MMPLFVFSDKRYALNSRAQKTNGQPQGRLDWCRLIVQLFRHVNESLRRFAPDGAESNPEGRAAPVSSSGRAAI